MVRFGEREGLSDEPRQALAQGIVEAFIRVKQVRFWSYPDLVDTGTLEIA